MFDKNKKVLRDSYKLMFDTEAGRIVLNDMIKRYFMLRPTYIQGDAMTSAFNEGRRSVMLEILAMLNYDEDKVKEKMANIYNMSE